MKILVLPMAGLKQRLLEKMLQKRDHALGNLPLTSPRIRPDTMAVCKAVEDRISKHIDLASRTDLTDQQLIDALRPFLKIVKQNDLPYDFSAAEIRFLAHGIPQGDSGRRERARIRF